MLRNVTVDVVLARLFNGMNLGLLLSEMLLEVCLLLQPALVLVLFIPMLLVAQEVADFLPVILLYTRVQCQ